MTKLGRPFSQARIKIENMQIGDEIILNATARNNKSIYNMLSRVASKRADSRFTLRKITNQKVSVRCVPRGDVMMRAALKRPSVFSRILKAVGL